MTALRASADVPAARHVADATGQRGRYPSSRALMCGGISIDFPDT